MIDARAQLRAWWPVVAYAVLILGVSSIPARALPEAELVRYDKFIHFAEYAVLGVLLVRGLTLGWPSLGSLNSLVVGAVLAAVFGGIDEWYQSFTEGRDPSVWDVFADTAGGFCGAALALVRYRGARGAQRHHREESYGHGTQVRDEITADR